MEQWQPVIEIVERRKRRNRLALWATVAAVALGLGIFWGLFGAVTMEAWREMTSGEFTEESAWWRARGLVRGQLGEGREVRFDPLERAVVSLKDGELATVVLAGTLLGPDGAEEPARWQVRLRFDAARNQWLPAPREVPGTVLR